MEKKDLNPREQDEKKDYLIGPGYYKQYKCILRIVISCIVFGMTVAWLISMLIEPSALWFLEVGRWIGMTVMGCLIACGIVTVIFTIFQYNNVEINVPVQVCLGEAGEPRRGEISRSEAFFGVVGGIIFLIIFLMIPQIFSGIFQHGKEVIPIFNLVFIKETWPIILIIGGLGILKDFFKLIYLRYNIPVMLVTIVSNIGVAYLSFHWLRSGQLMNTQFITKIIGLFEAQEYWIIYLFDNIQSLLLAIIIFGLVIDVFVTITKTIASKR